MVHSFIRHKPLQATKLAAIVIGLVVAIGGISGVIPSLGLGSLFIIIWLTTALILVIAAELVLAGYRTFASANSRSARFTNRPKYTAIRAGEVLGALATAGGIGYVLLTLPAGPMAGPGAIGLLFILVGLSGLVIAGSLVRTLVEFYLATQPQGA